MAPRKGEIPGRRAVGAIDEALTDLEEQGHAPDPATAAELRALGSRIARLAGTQEEDTPVSALDR